MCRQRHPVDEASRHDAAMRRDMRDMALRQPCPQDDHHGDGGEKSEGKGIQHTAVTKYAISRNHTDYMTQDANHLVWLDMEMTGLEPERDRIIELAIIVTNGQLETVAESPVWVVHQEVACLEAMDDWNRKTHGRSGLIERVKTSTLDEAVVEAAALTFVQTYVPQGISPLCGNSVGQDRRFMVRYLPRFEAWFHYRNLDVSTLKELCRRWKPEVAKGFVKKSDHTAAADIRESIEELKYYREHFIRL